MMARESWTPQAEQLAADCMPGHEESPIRHEHENAAEAPGAYNGVSVNGDNPLNGVSHSKVHPIFRSAMFYPRPGLTLLSTVP